MFMSRHSLGAAALGFGVLLGAPAEASPLVAPMQGFGQNLSPQDKTLLTQALQQALEQGKSGASADWSDNATGHAGRATVLRTYEKNGMPCGSVEHVFTQGGGYRYELPFCRQSDGSWKIAF